MRHLITSNSKSRLKNINNVQINYTYFFRREDKKIIVNFVRLVKTVTEMVEGCLRMMKSCHICIRWLKSISCQPWKIWDSVYISLFLYTTIRPQPLVHTPTVTHPQSHTHNLSFYCLSCFLSMRSLHLSRQKWKRFRLYLFTSKFDKS